MPIPTPTGEQMTGCDTQLTTFTTDNDYAGTIDTAGLLEAAANFAAGPLFTLKAFILMVSLDD